MRRRASVVFVCMLFGCAQTDVIAREISAAHGADAGSDAGSDATVSNQDCVARTCTDFDAVGDHCDDVGARVSIGDACDGADGSLQTSRFALCACTELVSTHALKLDAWDSRQGTFEVSPTFTPETGFGDACACDDDDHLDIAALVAAHANDNDDVALGIEPARFDGYVAKSGDAPIELACGRYYFDGLHGSGTLRWHITGHVLVFVEGDVAVDDDFEVSLATGAALDLFISGNVRASKKLTFGDEGAAAHARIYVAGDGTFDLGEDSVIAGALYAPSAELVPRGKLTIYGAAFVRRAAPLDDVVIHYDLAARVPASCALAR